MENFCIEESSSLSLIGAIITILKIVIPIIIIIVSFLKFRNAKEEDKGKRVIFRFLFAILVFFMPAILLKLFFSLSKPLNMIDKSNEDVCYSCIVHPWKGCENAPDIDKNA